MRKFTISKERNSNAVRLLLPLVISVSVILTTVFVIYGNTEIRSRANGSAYQDVCAGLTGYRRVMCEETDGAFTQPKVKDGTPCKKGDPPKPCGNNGIIYCGPDIYGDYAYGNCHDNRDFDQPMCKLDSIRKHNSEFFKYEYVAKNNTFHTWMEKCTKQICRLDDNGFQTYYEPMSCTKSNHTYIPRAEGVEGGLCGPGDCLEPRISSCAPPEGPEGVVECIPGHKKCDASTDEPGTYWLRTCSSYTIAECPNVTYYQYDSIKCHPGETCVEFGNGKAECR